MGTQIIATVSFTGVWIVGGVCAAIVIAVVIDLGLLAVKRRRDADASLILLPLLLDRFGSNSKAKEDTVKGWAHAPAKKAPPAKESASSPVPGEVQIQKLVAQYKTDLTKEAKRVADRVKADRASRDHVLRAEQNLRTPRNGAREFIDVLLSVGSLVLGGAISHWSALTNGGPPASQVAGAAMAGVALMAIAITLKFRRP